MTGKPRIRLTRDVPSLQGIFKAGTVMEVLTVNVGDGYEHEGLFGKRTKVPRITGLPADAFEFVRDGEPIRVVGSADPHPVKVAVYEPQKPEPQAKPEPQPPKELTLDDLDLEGLV